jgi:ABC-type dipeptide/oligopeptide/nickel transport system permease component
MTRFVARRIIQSAFVFVGVTAIVYAAVFVLPGDPIKALSPQRPMSPLVEAQLRAHYDLDAPLWSQYLGYLRHLVHGDLGNDFYGRPVLGLMAERWPVTLGLAVIAWTVEVVVGVGLGLWAGLRRGRPVDHAILLLGIALLSIPAFVLAFTGQLLVGVKAGLLPVAGVQQGWPVSYLLPGVLLGLVGIASVSRLVRSSVVENLSAGYVRTAYAKGLPAHKVILHHVLRNSLIATVTYLALDFGALLAGTIVVEGIFNLPGIGQLLFSGIRQQNGPLVVGVASTLVLAFLLINLAVDVLYGVLDPRIRHERP